jgi:hypothetical protein
VVTSVALFSTADPSQSHGETNAWDRVGSLMQMVYAVVLLVVAAILLPLSVAWHTQSRHPPIPTATQVASARSASSAKNAK